MSEQTSSYHWRPQGPRRPKSALPQFVGPERFAAEILPPLPQSPGETGETEFARIPDRAVQLMRMFGHDPRRETGAIFRRRDRGRIHRRPPPDLPYRVIADRIEIGSAAGRDRVWQVV